MICIILQSFENAFLLSKTSWGGGLEEENGVEGRGSLILSFHAIFHVKNAAGENLWVHVSLNQTRGS